jgi:NAD(P)-dependent dehydrogenase (short-subunit alcohol dehydrogenase family)
MSNFDFTGKVALVTGAGRGIGREIAMRLASSGAKVCVNDINPDVIHQTVGAIQTEGGEAMGFRIEVDNKMGVQTMFMEVIDTWRRFDILVNHANIKPKSPIIKMDEWHWEKVLNVNLKGTFLCNQTAGRALQEQGQGGVIINMTHSQPLMLRSAYQASQTGIIGLTQVCAEEFAECDVRVNLVSVVDSMPEANPQIPSHIQTATDIMLFLCSDEARQITGQVIPCLSQVSRD